MSEQSLTNNILSYKVDVGNAAKMRTHRIQNPDAQMCPLWTGYDLTGRESCEYGFYTKVEGCNSAEDRISVENTLRPQYTNFVTYNAEGISGYIYDTPLPGRNIQTDEMNSVAKKLKAVQKSTGQFGTVSPSESRKPTNAKQEWNNVGGMTADGMAVDANNRRVGQKVASGFRSPLNQTFNQYGTHQGGGYKVSDSQYIGNNNVGLQVPARLGDSYARLGDIASADFAKTQGRNLMK